MDSTFQLGDQAMQRTQELLDTAKVGKWPRWEELAYLGSIDQSISCLCARGSQYAYADHAAQFQVQLC